MCRPTQSEAEDYYDYYVVEMPDDDALDRQLAIQKRRSVFNHPGELDEHRRRFAAGGGAYALVGTPQRIADEILAMS